jgi:hypothetical protein
MIIANDSAALPHCVCQEIGRPLRASTGSPAQKSESQPMDDAANVTRPAPSTGAPADAKPVVPAALPGSPTRQVTIQFGPTPSKPGSRLKGSSK